MCGIVGYIGKRNNPGLGLEALKRLEYRGYDSSGMAVFNPEKKKVVLLRAVGRISNLEKKFLDSPVFGSPFILHTRWATHGRATEANAHPHYDCKKNIFLVHNGIIENYRTLKGNLVSEGHRFSSQTDTEVLCHLIEKFFQGNLEDAVRKALRIVKGTYGLAVIAKDDPEKIVIARNSSPLLIGIGHGEHFIASDVSALVKHTKKVIYLDDREIGVIRADNFHITTLDNHKVEKKTSRINWDIEDAQKGGYSHFMLKEIFETPEAIKNVLLGRLIEKQGLVKLGGIERVIKNFPKIQRLVILSCGSSYFTSLIGEYMLEEYVGIPTKVEYASEFRYRKPVLDKNTAVLAISQSGETADTIAALREAKQKGVLSLGIINVVGSTIAKETDAGIYNHAGPEIAVACTKTFLSQVVALTLLAIFLGEKRGMSLGVRKKIIHSLKKLPSQIEKILSQNSEIRKLAKKYYKYNNFLYIGRKYNFPVALEGAMKLKEVSYIHAEGYASGEMKHGSIALIDRNFPSFAIAPLDSVYEKTISNIEEIRARKGKVIALTTQRNRKIKDLVNDVIYIPKTLEMLSPVLSVIPLQLFAYYVAIFRGCDVDKPRNLAKSVTVE